MAKPVLIVKLNIRDVPDIEITKSIESIKNSTNNEYHIVMVGCDVTDITFECYNDYKGLQDIDIEKLIKDYMKHG